MIPVGKVQSSHQTALTILLPVMAMGIELILQTKSCSFKKKKKKEQFQALSRHKNVF